MLVNTLTFVVKFKLNKNKIDFINKNNNKKVVKSSELDELLMDKTWFSMFNRYLREQAIKKKIGCYYDDIPKRDMSGYSFRDSELTPDMCFITCTSLGFKYAGLQDGYRLINFFAKKRYKPRIVLASTYLQSLFL